MYSTHSSPVFSLHHSKVDSWKIPRVICIYVCFCVNYTLFPTHLQTIQRMPWGAITLPNAHCVTLQFPNVVKFESNHIIYSNQPDNQHILIVISHKTVSQNVHPSLRLLSVGLKEEEVVEQTFLQVNCLLVPIIQNILFINL